MGLGVVLRFLFPACQDPEKHTNVKEYFPEAGFSVFQDFRWVRGLFCSTIRGPRRIPLCAIPLCVLGRAYWRILDFSFGGRTENHY